MTTTETTTPSDFIDTPVEIYPGTMAIASGATERHNGLTQVTTLPPRDPARLRIVQGRYHVVKWRLATRDLKHFEAARDQGMEVRWSVKQWGLPYPADVDEAIGRLRAAATYHRTKAEEIDRWLTASGINVDVLDLSSYPPLRG